MVMNRLLMTAVILAFIGGGTSALSGSLFWVPYVIYGASLLQPIPIFGFIGFVLGILIVLGGIMLSRERIILGANLALWCGIANWFFGFFSTVLAIGAILHPSIDVSQIAFILALVLTVVFPLVGGILGLMVGRSQK